MVQYKVIRKKRQINEKHPCDCYQNDHVDLVVEGAGIRLCRLSTLCIPAEVSAFIPRVEIRQRWFENGHLVCEDERIYNSITVVHAPRHPAENQLEPLPAPVTPASGKNPNGPPPGQAPPPPEVPAAPGLEQPGAAQPPEIPSQPEPHPPPVSPFPVRPIRRNFSGHGPPNITINKRPLGQDKN